MSRMSSKSYSYTYVGCTRICWNRPNWRRDCGASESGSTITQTAPSPSSTKASTCPTASSTRSATSNRPTSPRTNVWERHCNMPKTSNASIRSPAALAPRRGADSAGWPKNASVKPIPPSCKDCPNGPARERKPAGSADHRRTNPPGPRWGHQPDQDYRCRPARSAVRPPSHGQ
jgi:hypothetical protein